MSSLLGMARKGGSGEYIRKNSLAVRSPFAGLRYGRGADSDPDEMMYYGSGLSNDAYDTKELLCFSSTSSGMDRPEVCTDLSNYADVFKKADEDNEGGDCCETKVLATFNWKHGGKEVYLISYEGGTEKKFKMARTGTSFILIRYIPKAVCEYMFLVDGKERYATDQPQIKTESGIRNVVDASGIVSIESILEARNNESGTLSFDQSVPDSLYMTQEAIQIPSLLLYRTPLIKDADRLANDIHAMARHIYRDTNSQNVLGPNYRTYTTIYRWERRIDDEVTTHKNQQLRQRIYRVGVRNDATDSMGDITITPEELQNMYIRPLFGYHKHTETDRL